MPKLTIVVPTYNRPDYLAECLESIAAQTYRDFGLIVLDNASTEEYSAVLERFESLGIEYIRNPENIGAIRNISKARELAAQSTYHMVFHDDDLMHPRMLEWQVAMLDSHPGMVWVATECVPFTGAAGALSESADTGPDLEVMDSPQELVRRFLENVPLNFGSVMFRTAAGGEVEFDFETFEIIADRVLLCDIASRGSVGLIREPLVLYRHHAAQDSHNPVFRERHALALMEHYQALLPSPLSDDDRALVQHHSTNYLLHARAAVAPENRLRFAELVDEARGKGLFRWSAIDGQGVAALARMAGLGAPFEAIRPTLGRIKRSLSGR